MWGTGRAGRCYGRWGVNACGGQLRRRATRGRWDSVLILCRIPKNANQQQHYHQEHGTDQVM